MIAVDNSFSLETISLLIDLGCDVNAKDTDGNTPLHTSALLENESVFKTLLSKGADVDIEDNDGQNVRSLCEEGNNVNLIALIKANDGQLAESMTMT